jgi:hypothetical protein
MWSNQRRRGGKPATNRLGYGTAWWLCSVKKYFFYLALQPQFGPPWNSLFHFGFLGLRQSIGLLGRVISSSRRLYLHTNTRTRAHTHTHTKQPGVSGIRTHDPGFRASEDSACLRPLGYRDRQKKKCYSCEIQRSETRVSRMLWLRKCCFANDDDMWRLYLLTVDCGRFRNLYLVILRNRRRRLVRGAHSYILRNVIQLSML